MKLQFDYLQGPVLGHKRRCEILMQTARAMKHQIVDHDPDWLVVDYPSNQLPTWDGHSRRMMMGVLPQNESDYAWHALGPKAERTLHGAEYLILDPKLADYKKKPKYNRFFVACGGADPLNLTPQILPLVPADTFEYDSCFVIGPNFKHEFEYPHGWHIMHAPSPAVMLDYMACFSTVICAWGNTAFEASYLGCRVFAIPTCEEHIDEIKCFGLEPILPTELATLPKRLLESVKQVKLDLDGAKRILQFMAKLKEKLQ